MDANEIVTLLSALGAEKVSIKQNDVIACCPIHKERRPSFGVSLSRENHPWNCYACHQRGLLPNLVMQVKECSFKDAVAFLQRFGDYTLILHDRSVLPVYEHRLKNIDDEIPVGDEVFEAFAESNLRMRLFLRSRRISKVIQDTARLKRHEDRVLFVWYDDVRPVGITSRSYVKKYDVLRGVPFFRFKKHQHLYFGAPILYEMPVVYVCEGEMDCLRLRTCGYSACALSGTVITEAQIKMIVRYARSVVLLFDNDAEGRDGCQRATKSLGCVMPVFVPKRIPDEYTDPGAASEGMLQRLLMEENLTLAV